MGFERMGWEYLGMFPGHAGPAGCLDPWVVKPLGGSPSVAKARADLTWDFGSPGVDTTSEGKDQWGQSCGEKALSAKPQIGGLESWDCKLLV